MRPIRLRPVAAGNWRKGRRLPAGMTVDVVVEHVTEGTAASARSWFNDPASDASTHYMVTRAGDVEQFVDEDDTAFGNGKIVRPTAAIVLERPGMNPNAYSISIEHEGTGRDELAPEQREATIELQADIARRRGIPINRRHFLRHNEIRADKACPGGIDVDRLVRAIAAASGVAAPLPSVAPRVVWSDYFKDWLVVASVRSDTEWEFLLASDLPQNPARLRAQTPLSQMKTHDVAL